jgi:hypothetical protein
MGTVEPVKKSIVRQWAACLVIARREAPRQSQWRNSLSKARWPHFLTVARNDGNRSVFLWIIARKDFFNSPAVAISGDNADLSVG